MAAMSMQSPVVRVKPQPDIYTLLLILAVLFLAVTIGVVLYDLMRNYGMTFMEIFAGQSKGNLPI